MGMMNDTGNAMEYMKQTFLNKRVQVYPGDTTAKFGFVRDMNAAGVVFELENDWYERDQYSSELRRGAIAFYAWNKLTFVLVERK